MTPLRPRQIALFAGIVAVFAIAGSILVRAPRIDLGWQSSRRTAEYRRHVRNAMHAATSNGAIHSVDVSRGLMRIHPSDWEHQDEEMRRSLIRLTSRYFEVQGRPRKVTVVNAFGNEPLARYDGNNSYVFLTD